MAIDIDNLRGFYNSALGEVARRLIGRVIRARWPNVTGLTVAAFGYGTPYLDRFLEEAKQCLALMPAEQGVAIWPDWHRCAVALVKSEMLPLPDGSADRLLVIHALESAQRPQAVLEELWRISTPQGRVLIVVPSRRGIWARADSTPYGHGLPYSKAQLRDLLHETSFCPVFWGEALYAPPIARRLLIRTTPAIEHIGAAFGLPFGGVHIVEAIKQVYRPVDTRGAPRTALVTPALAPGIRHPIPISSPSRTEF